MKKLLFAAMLLTLNGCAADYLNHYDTVTLAAGDANRQNQLMQTVDPYNPASNNTKIEDAGSRSVAAVAKARQVTGGGGTTGGSAATMPPPPPPVN
ncbi:hypothetical protein [Mesorhizobium sp. M0006]|uniref:hypothetical protein n=1 Tax=Mesorhizobium sp. M0006 TaxID=2956838 RepID=UPI00333B5E8F